MKKKARKAKKKTGVFDQIAAGMDDAVAFAKGSADASKYRVHVPSDVNVKEIRTTLHMTQTEFCSRFGFGIASLRDWEQGRYHPDGAVRAYLIAISREPKAIERALKRAS